MTPSPNSHFLRRALLLDAVATGAAALLLALGAGFVTGPLGLPEALLRGAGLVLVPFVGVVGWAATRDNPSAGAISAIIDANAAWVVASMGLLASGLAAPTLVGQVFVIGQALVVGLFAELQFIGLRRARAASA
jgi:hypothetical protein